MKLKLLGTLLCLLFCAQLNAQKFDVTTSNGSISVSNQNVIKTQIFDENKSLIGEVKEESGSVKTSEQVVKILSVDTDASKVSVYADDVNRTPVVLPSAGKNRWLIPNAQKLWIEVKIIDFEKSIFDSKRIVVDKPDLPDEDPVGPSVAPIDLPGLRVLMVVESEMIPSYPKTQMDALFSEKLRLYLNEKCVKNKGEVPDLAPEWRIMDVDTKFEDTCDLAWCKALKRPMESLPWIIISNGQTGYEGPLPQTLDQIIKLVEKY